MRIASLFRLWSRFWQRKGGEDAITVPNPEPRDSCERNHTDPHLALIDSRTIPSTPQRTPVLSYLSESSEYYANLLSRSAVIFKNGPRLPDDEISMHNNRFVTAQWGLIARGKEAVPVAVGMLRSEIPEVREAAAGVLGAVGRDDGVVLRVLEALEAEYRCAA